MWRGIMVTLVVACLLACGAAVWMARDAVIAPFVLPGATDVVVSPRGLAALRVSYHAAGQSYDWRAGVWRQVVAQGWHGRDYTFGTTRQFVVTWYTRSIELGPLIILESAVVGGDPRDPSAVIVEVHSELHLRP